MNNQISAIHKLASLAGVEYFTTQLPDRVRDKIESAGLSTGYFVWASPGITGEIGRLVNLAESVVDKIVSNEIDLGTSFNEQQEEEGQAENGESEITEDSIIKSLIDAISSKTSTNASEWQRMPSDTPGVICIGNLTKKLIARGSLSETESIRVTILRDPDMNEASFSGQEMDQSTEDQVIEDETVQAIVEEVFKESEKPVDALGEHGMKAQIDFLQEVISCAFSYLNSEEATEIFESVFDRTPFDINKKDQDGNQFE